VPVKHRPHLGRLVVLATALAAPGGDLILRQRTTGPTAGEQTQYFSGDKMVTDDPHTRSIVDLAARTLTTADKEKRTYWVRTFDDLRAESERTQRSLAQLPNEARRQLGLDMPVTVKPTGRTERIAGYAAREYAVTAGPATGTVWITDQLAQPAAAREWERFSAVIGGAGRPGGRLAGELAKYDGVPLRSKMTLSMGPRTFDTSTEVIEVRQAAPPSEVLAVPAGFKKVDASEATQ